jgi:sugar phosphate isomerase/epimerase
MPDIGINLEFARSENLGLEEALVRAAEAGYRFVEPYLYTPIELAINSHLTLESASPYHHLRADQVDCRRLGQLRRSLDLEFSAVDAHATLLLPQVGVPYLRRAVEVAAELECPVVMSDEGPVPSEWIPLEKCFDILCISLEAVLPYARSHGVRYAMELHNSLTTRPDMLVKLLQRFSDEELGVNFDTGNSFLAGNDPVEYLRRVAGRVIHVHIKDIPSSQLHLRGQVTGTRVGVAAGDGVIDLAGIVATLAEAGYEGVLSIECDTLEQARKSLAHMKRLLGGRMKDER